MSAWVLALALGAAACGSPPGRFDVVVDLQTDVLPVREFATVRTEVSRTPFATDARSPVEGFVDVPVDATSSFVPESARVAEFLQQPEGALLVRVSLLDRFGDPIDDQTVRVVLRGNVGVTVQITRNCVDVVCPPEGGDPALSECRGGACVDPGCSPETPERCGDPACDDTLVCSSPAACADPFCSAGTCLLFPVDDRCGAGEYCHPARGCLPEVCRDTVLDGGGPDGGPGEPGSSCGPNGLVCVDGECVCLGGSTETLCGSGADEDCDGRSDCGDEDCNGRACGPNGRICRSGACVCPGGPPPETACADGQDGDCDGRADCQDSDCARRACRSGQSQYRCCSSTCVNTNADERNCGGCGLRCASGRTCGVSNDHDRAACHCRTNAECRINGAGWTCFTTAGESLCNCQSNADCATGQTCAEPTGHNYCRY